MFTRNRFGIGFKITAGLLAFVFILALATIWLVAGGFAQAEQTAVQHSAASLRNQAQASLVTLTSLQAQLYDAELQKAAHLTQIAADYLVNVHQAGDTIDWTQSERHVIWSGSQLVRSPDGLLYFDADPARQTEILHPGNVPPDAITDQSLADTAVLDQLFPSLLAQADNAVGIYFQGPQLTFRYYPVRNLPELEIENGAAAAAQTMHIETFPVAPQNNPERHTIWLPPYKDDAGQGLLVSANTPIYFGDAFQGYIGIDVSLARLIEQLDSLKPTPGSSAFLIDADSQLIAAPPEGIVLLTDGDGATAIFPEPLGLPLTAMNPTLSPVLSLAQGTQEGASQIELGSQTMLVTYAPLPEMGWRLLVMAPLSEVTAESRAVSQSIRSDGLATVRNTLLTMSALFLIATLASVFLTYRAINRPLHRLLDGVRAVTSGNLEVSVPVTSRDELGELAGSFNKMTGELDRRTRQLSETSSELAVKKTQLRVAALEERQRLARELHDSVSQALYGIALGARTARTLLDRDPEKVAEPLDYVLSLAEAGLSEMRALIFELRPESLQNEGLVAALAKQADALQARYKLEVVTNLCPEPDISLDAKEVLFRVAQEALHNTAKHASASRVELEMRCMETTIGLTIRDNGKGFNPEADFPGHLGLQSMRERVANLNGDLKISSQPGQGTTIAVHLPLQVSRR